MDVGDSDASTEGRTALLKLAGNSAFASVLLCSTVPEAWRGCQRSGSGPDSATLEGFSGSREAAGSTFSSSCAKY